jgi:murein DD-endopeptidase MepM/ murein hydrolase activator NlpD
VLRLTLIAALVGAFFLAVLSVASAASLVLRRPATGPITSGFGGARGHEGVDFGKLRRLGIVAAAPGKVLRTGYLSSYDGYGKVVLIAHARGFRTLYAHLSRIRVRPGQRVRAGRWIGNAGCTGRCTGTHLHFEVRRFGRPLNPLRFLR